LAVDRLHEVADVEHRLAEEAVAALFLDLHQPALDRADRGRADVAVRGGVLLGALAHVLQHRPQVLQVQQRRPASSAILNTRLQHAGLDLVEVSMRASSSGPMSVTVARTGWPCSPNTSHSVGAGARLGLGRPALLAGPWRSLSPQRAGLRDAGAGRPSRRP
jgi:hypothetical protein